MRKIPNLDIDELCFAYAQGDREARHYLNLTNGELLFISDYTMTRREIDELEEELEDEDKYLFVPGIDSHEAYQLMEAFTETVASQEIREELQDALDRPKPFRRFKDKLGDYPDEEKKWYKFEAEAHRQAIIDWLTKEDIAIP